MVSGIVSGRRYSEAALISDPHTVPGLHQVEHCQSQSEN